MIDIYDGDDSLILRHPSLRNFSWTWQFFYYIDTETDERIDNPDFDRDVYDQRLAQIALVPQITEAWDTRIAAHNQTNLTSSDTALKLILGLIETIIDSPDVAGGFENLRTILQVIHDDHPLP